MNDPTAPSSIYETRRAQRETDLAHWSRLDTRLQRTRLAIFAIGLVMTFASVGDGRLPLSWILVPAVLFVFFLVWHDRVLKKKDRASRSLAFYERGIARLEYRFAGMGTSGEELQPDAHPYARDLDLFGAGSLFERLCMARTRGGEEALASWLLAPADAETIRERQTATTELTERLSLREELWLVGDDVRSELQPEVLRSWGSALPVGFHSIHRIIAPVLASLTVGALLAWIFGWAGPAGPAAFTLAASAQGVFAWSMRARVAATVRAVEGPTRELDLLARLLERIEEEPVSSPLLTELQARLQTGGIPPSAQILRLRKRVELLESRKNQFFAPIAALLLWTSQLAMSIEEWRLSCGPVLGPWIDSVSEFEALISIASHAFENPAHTYPALAEDGAQFAARGLGHPLLSPEQCVTNDVRLSKDPQILIVSGSNMSGKSTLLRSVGVATLMAQAGAPVCAEALRLSPLSMGASLHVLDSLQEGTSHFYAEIMRVRQVVELAEGERPLLFLLDEIFHGTNSHDRGLGAEAIIKALAERGAIGLVTTHDLALTRVADELEDQVKNVHFEDQIEDGQIHFDYKMRKGVVTKSNAVALMRSVGLPV